MALNNLNKKMIKMRKAKENKTYVCKEFICLVDDVITHRLEVGGTDTLEDFMKYIINETPGNGMLEDADEIEILESIKYGKIYKQEK